MVKRLTLATVAALLFLLPSQSQACSCSRQTLEEALGSYDVVFVGTVMKLEVVDEKDDVHLIRATVRPELDIIGRLGEEVEFSTDDGCCYCSFGFEIAETYLFFANYRRDSPDLLATSTCSRTSPVGGEQGRADLIALGLDHFVEGGG